MKNIFTSILFICSAMLLQAQCDTLMISPTSYTLISTSSTNGNNNGRLTYDDDVNTRWRSSGAGPHEIILDMGANYDLTGMSMRTRWTGSGKVGTYKLYTSYSASNWGDGEKWGENTYPVNDNEDTTYFGTVNARYVRCVFESTSGDLQLSEIRFYRSTCSASGKENQPIDFPAIPKQSTQAPLITMSASTPTGNPVVYSVLSGPATVSGSTLTLSQAAGTVKVRAEVASTSTHYASQRDIEFEVIDLATYDPTVTTRLVDSLPLEIRDTTLWYPIYINATIPEPDFLQVNSVSVMIEGEKYPAATKNGFFYVMWKPAEYKTYNIEITATGSNGNTASITRNVEVVNGSSTHTVTSLKDVVIEFGGTNSRNYSGTYVFPQSVGTYKKISADFIVECPNNNCDDWDRWAYIDIKAPDGNWIQIIRYITPYGVACNHSIDLTQYAALLQGAVEMRVFIDTWGTGGWQLTLDLEYEAGKPDYDYTMVDEVWDGTFDFGNYANLQPVPQYEFWFREGSEKLELLVSSTGHGWGQANTGNAAEFYHAKHDVMFNSSKAYEHDLWNNCNPNPDNCNGQRGTWQYNRAGWCPGAIAPPSFFEVSNLNPGGSVVLDYKFQSSYVDLCHPNHPNCVSGTTCANCNEGYNPHYQFDGQMITYSNTPQVYGEKVNTTSLEITDKSSEELDVSVYPNPGSGLFRIASENAMKNITGAIYSIDGTQHKRYFFSDELELENQLFDLTSLAPGTYFVELRSDQGKAVKQIVIQP